MRESSPHLQITHAPGAAGWDDRQWRFALRDSGVLARLPGDAPRLLLHCYALADLRTGEFDLPARYTMQVLGISNRTLRRSRAALEEHGLIEDFGVSPQYPPNHRYRLLTPAPTSREAATGSRDQKPVADAASMPGRSDLTGGDKSVQPPGQNCPAPRPNLSPQSGGESERESSSAPGDSTAGGEPAPPGSLWHSPRYERAAAAALCCHGPIRDRRRAWRWAHGLVTQYRPTRREALHVLANAYAWRRAARRNEAPPIRDLPAFIKSELRKGKLDLDDRVWQYRQQRRRRRKQQQSGAAGDPVADLTADRRAELLEAAVAEIRGERDRLAQLDPARREHRERELVRHQLQKQESSL